MSLQELSASTPAIVRIAAVADLHCTEEGRGRFEPLFAAMAEDADVLLLCGDLTHHGLPTEARILVEETKGLRHRPIVAVLGNHDFEADRPSEVRGILNDAGIRVLDGDSVELGGVGFVGVKGFMGGFEGHMLQAWGEPLVKLFVREAMEESLKLESGLARLKSAHRIALLHYSPILGTLAGEAPEVIPFLGSSRLEDALGRQSVKAVFHGHAHYGSPRGRTRTGIDVFNVAMPLLKRLDIHRPPFRSFDLPAPVAHGR